MMMSDSLPFTPYDSMEYETVTPHAPNGFVSRDQVANIQEKDLKKLMQSGPPNSINPMQVPVEQIPIQQRPVLQTRQAEPTATKETYVDLGEQPISSKSKDISNYKNIYDLIYIVIAILIVEVAILFLVRYSPELFGQVLNRWFDKFGFTAILINVACIVLGFIVSRYIYTEYIKKQYAQGKWNPLKFVGTLVGVQVVHDLLFYYGIINQVPRGHNTIMDTLKDYAVGGPKIIAGNSVMMILSAGIAMLLKSQPAHILASIGTLSFYTLPYILYTKNEYSIS